MRAIVLLAALALCSCATHVRFNPGPDVLVLWGSAEVCDAPGVCSHGAPISDTFAGLLRGVAELAATFFGRGPQDAPTVIVNPPPRVCPTNDGVTCAGPAS